MRFLPISTYFRLACLCAFALAGAHAGFAQMPLTGAGASGALALFTSFNPANSTATLTNNNLTAAGGAIVLGAQVTTGQSAGLFYFKATITAVATGGNNSVGFFNLAQAYSTCISAATGCIMYFPSGHVFDATNTLICTCASYTAGDDIDIAADIPHHHFWLRKNGAGNWNNDVIGNQNPVGNVGGLSLSSLNATIYPAVIISAACTCGPWTANFGQTAFTDAPAGYAGWPAP